MGIPYEPGALQATTAESWEGLHRKVSLAFTDQMVLSYKPLAEHFRAAVQRKGSRFGQVPAIVLTVLDGKITSQCKAIDLLAEKNPAYAAALVCRAAAACPSLRLSDDGLWIGRSDPFSPELVTKLLTDRENRVESVASGNGDEMHNLETTCSQFNRAFRFEAVYIPAYVKEELRTISLTALPDVYYLDTIANALGLQDTGQVFMSRQIGKAPDGSRLFWGARERLPVVKFPDVELLEQFEPSKIYRDICSQDGPMEALRNTGGRISRNERASFLVGHAIDGDAILATVGSTWTSDGRCIYDNFTLSCFHRLMLGRNPWGAYKLSRRSLLVADLPKVYTCRAHWQGASPKSLLADFCHQHRLSEAQYTCNDTQESCNSTAGGHSLEIGHTKGLMSMNNNGISKQGNPGSSKQGPFQCKVRVGSAGNKAPTYFQSDGFFRSRNDAIQSAALNALLSYGRWSGTGCLCSYFQNQDCCKSNGDFLGSNPQDSTVYKSDESSGQSEFLSFRVIAEEDTLGDRPPPGSMVFVSYTVNLIDEGSCCNGDNSSDMLLIHDLESQSDFKFELGVGAVIGQIDACVSQATVGQTLQFCLPVEALGVLFAASSELGENRQGLVLEYTVKLLKFEEAMEERIESSHFAPPLSKQRIEFARTMINALEAKTLVDLGCGSGSLLEALLREPNTLEYMIGIDISRKALIRGAKSLSASLAKQNAAHSIQSITLYEGSISAMDLRLRSPDLATCIEVVEHMDPEPLRKLGKSILGKLVPKVWLVSTPNIEYNPVIRGLEWDPESNSLNKPGPTVFPELTDSKKLMDMETQNLRNHDHRFEWTRAEFREWASLLASQYGYQVRFAGVGGDGEDDDNSPGFATQIAVFAHNGVVFPTFCQEAGVSKCDGSDSVPTATEVEMTDKRLETEQDPVSQLKELWQWTSPAHPAAIL
ncbi:small RNA 2'-O-methyltransferase isoform X2 [Physcomitrium patens]|nr:small RNA 2'-O-methyltransferase-like isoform X2 [Physcomitrium patens]|eukprot:XP_024382976.1 small RNA 2'-O-methyltransferase-like isoform X2 [Physcomitrella patens]